MNEYDDLIAQTKQADVAQTARIGFSVAADTNPDAYAEAQRVARRTGVPVQTVLNLPAEMKRQDRVGSIDFDTLAQTAPATAALLADVERAKVAHDNVDNMGEIERKLRQFGGGAVEAVGMAAGGTGQLIDIAQRNALGGFANLFLPKPMAGGEVTAESLAGPLVGEGWRAAGGGIKGFARRDVMIPAGQQTFGDQVAAVLGQVVGQIAMLPLARGAGLYAQGADVMAEKVAPDEAGQGMKDLAILGGAAVTGITEKWALDKLLGPLAVPIKNQIGAAMARIGIAAAAEGGQEFSENVLQDALRIALTNRDAKIDLGQSFEEGGVGAAVGGIVRTVVEAGLHIRARGARGEQQAERGAEFLANINKLAAADKLLARDPDNFQAFVAQAAEGSPVQQVFIDANTLMQSGFAEQLAAVSPAVADQLETAAATGGQIAIPVEEYAARIAPTEYAKGLLDHLKTEPDGFSRAEAQEYMQSGAAQELQAEVERVMAEKQVDDTFKASAQVVKTAISDQLTAAGRFTPQVNDAYSAMVGNFYAVQAARMGTTPEEMFKRYPLRIGAESIAGGNKFDQGATLQQLRDQLQANQSELDSYEVEIRGGVDPDGDKYFGLADKVTEAMDAFVADLEQIPDDSFSLQAKTKDGRMLLVNPSAQKPGHYQLTRFASDGNPWGDTQYPTKKQAIKDFLDESDASTVKDFGGQLNQSAPEADIGEAKYGGIEYVPAPRDRINASRLREINARGLKHAQTGDFESYYTPVFQIAYQLGQNGVDISNEPIVEGVRYGAAQEFGVSKNYADDIAETGLSLAMLRGGKEIASSIWFKDRKAYEYRGILAGKGSDGEPIILPLHVENLDDSSASESIRNEPNASAGSDVLNQQARGNNGQFDPNDQNDGAGYIVDAVMQDAKGDTEKAFADLDRRVKDLEGAKQFLVPGAYEIEKRDIETARQRIKDGYAPEAKPVGSTYTPAEWKSDTDLIALAKKVFGTTHNVMEAGYVLPDGTMLDFSGRHYSTKDNHPYLRNQRSVDHRELHSENLKGQSLTDALENSGSEGMYEFMARTGAMRIDGNSGVASISRPPSPKQISILGNARKGDYVALSYNRPDGQILHDGEMDSSSPAKVKKFFDEALNTSGTGGAYAQAARGSFNPATLQITLLKNADLSTFLHESGHFFLEVQADLASQLQQEAAIHGADTLKPGEQEVLADMQATFDWFGVRDLAEWNGLDFEEKRSYHEQFARGFEKYLFEGQAPAIEMQGVFQRFRAWMLNVYRDLKALNVELTDEVRGVFDRMLATSEQIVLAEQGRSMMPLFTSPEQIGMTPAEFADYQALGVDATNEAIEDLQARGLRDMQWIHNARGRIIKQLQKESAARRAEVQMEVRREVMSQPIYRAWQFLTGKITADDKIEPVGASKSDPNVLDETLDSLFVAIAKLGGISKDDVVKTWGIDPKDKPTSGLFGKPLWRIDGGLSIDGMAEALSQYGYLTLDENGKWDIRELEEKFKAELGGDAQYSSAYDYAGNQPVRPGDQVPNPLGLAAGRLDRASLTEIGLPAEIIEHLKTLRMTAQDGIHPDIVADLFGFSSGDELVRRLAAAESPKAEIEGLTDQRMLERFGDLSSDEAIKKAADKAIHNDARARMVATELNALAKATGQRKVLASAAKEFAAAMISRLKVRNIKPGQYASAEVRAAKAAEKASKTGDLATAAAEKRNQLIQNYATRAAYDAQEEVDKGLRYIKRFEGAVKGLDSDYIDQIDGLLERFDLRKGQSLREIDKRKSFAEWLAGQREQGLEPDVPPELENEAVRKSYKDMTVEEFRGLIDTIKQIEHLGRLKHKLLTARDERELALIVAEAEASIREFGGDERPVQLETPRGLVPWLEGIAAGHRKFASLLRQMDGGQDNGPLWRAMGRGMNEAATNEAVMIEQASVSLAELFKPILAMQGGTTGDKRFIPAINASLTRGGRLAVALNWGNETNRQRVMDGDRWTPAQANAVLSTLTREEWAFVQNVWDFIDSYWPAIEAKEKRVTGRAPDKVPASTFAVTLADGGTMTLRGGYYPIKYDANRDDKAEKHDAAAIADDMKRGAVTRSTTRRGHTKGRVENVKRPVKKTLDVITQHVSEVTHDLAWHEWLIDANRLIDAHKINQAIRDHYGPEVLRTMKDTLQAIATADIVPQSKMDQALLYLRANVSRSTMGLSLTTAFLQPFGLTQSMVRIGPKHVLRGMARWGGDVARFENSLTWIGEKSDFMRLRAKTFNRELHEIKGRVTQGHSRARQLYDASLFMLMQKMQMVADIPTWLGAYEKALAENHDDATAVALADQAVLDSQGGGQTKDMAELQRKHPMLTMFYSYFNVTLNLAAESTAKTDFKNPLAVAGWLSDMALLMIIPALGPALILHLLKGGGDDDDPEAWARRLAEWQAGYLLGTVIGLRELSGAVSGFDYSGPPAGRIIADLGKLKKQAEQGELDEGLVLSAVQVMGAAAGIPTVQIVRSWRGWNAWEEGDAPPTSILLGPPPRD